MNQTSKKDTKPVRYKMENPNCIGGKKTGHLGAKARERRELGTPRGQVRGAAARPPGGWGSARTPSRGSGSIPENSTWTPRSHFRNPPRRCPHSCIVCKSKRLETAQLSVPGNGLKAFFTSIQNKTAEDKTHTSRQRVRKVLFQQNDFQGHG